VSTPAVISHTTLKTWLFRDGFDIEGRISDKGLTSERYVLPTLDWITNVFGPYWQEVRNRLCAGYEKGSRVCHHFSHGAAWWSGICHTNTEERPEGAALLFGEWFYYRPGGHAANLAYVAKDGDGLLVTFEPQSSRIFTATIQERNSCDFLRI
jgi:hypothetical protein